ncbi:hypothetical protein [Streptomyces sp. NPDC059491]|uniref:hypothetical protein n=1 Tax=Streptomyces sp. NPDC059491 TaxID=3346850 RepID=UPI0036C8515C
MTDEADTDALAEAREWDARLGWAGGLIAEDPAERTAALDRHLEARRKVGAALRRFNELRRPGEWLGGPVPTDVTPSRAAYEEYREAMRRVLPDALWNRPGGDVRTWAGLPYALLFLEWEAGFPEEWTLHAKKWGTKERLLRDVAVPGHAEPARARLTDLVETVVRRPYRCKDRAYVRVARAVDSAELRARLECAARSDTPWARRHARYVLWLLDRPDVPNTVHVWQTRLEAQAQAEAEAEKAGDCRATTHHHGSRNR